MSPRKLQIDDLLNAVQVGAPRISPDGRWVVYQSRKTLLAENNYESNLWIVASDGSGSSTPLTNYEPSANAYSQFRARWSPDSGTVAYFAPAGGLTLLELEDGKVTSAKELEELKPHYSEVANYVTDMRWSPDGKHIAFLSSESPAEGSPPNTAVSIDILKGAAIASQKASQPAALSILNITTGAVEKLTDPSLDVKSLDWSPDSQKLVISALDANTRSHYLDADLYVVDVNLKKADLLLNQPGGDASPIWSPDGQWIAFWSQMGSNEWGWTYITTPAVIPAEGGEPRYLIENLLDELACMSYMNDFIWSEDSSRVYMEQAYRLTGQLFSIPLGGGKLERITPDDDVFRSDFSYGGGTFAFTEQSLITPPDVFVSPIDEFKSRRLTNANPWAAERAWPKVERLSWRSRDDKWDILGYALLPPDYDETKKYPLTVEVVGGPSMSAMKFSVWNPFPNTLFASEGYVHFVPNTRGRPGGSSVPFALAIKNERSFLRVPLEDVLEGVDLMIKKGIADPNRIGIMGQSYGGAMTATAIAHSDKFAAAAFHEGVSDFVYHLFKAAGDPVFQKHQRDQGAMGPPYEEEELEIAMRESPIYHIGNAKTPTLIESGELALHEHGTLLANALHYLGVPYDYYLYPRTGHVTYEPQLVEDELKRKLSWFGYWLQDKPYQVAEKQAEFDKWKQEQKK